MYKNVFGEKVSRARFKEMINAQKNRRDIIAAQLSRREMIKMGLLTGAGYLIAKPGLSARAGAPIPVGQPASLQGCSFQPFIDPLNIPPIKQPVPSLSPAPTAAPNTAAGEGRVIPHQAFNLFPPQKFYEVHQIPTAVSIHSQLPVQNLWGFDGFVPGPTYVARYGEPILVRNFNDLPADNGGFGLPSLTTHLHNGHTPSESDGNPCDFFERGFWYDQHYPNVLAGVLSTHQAQGGDINESMSTLWYHDHRVDHTAQNVYKGLYGMYLLFNQFDTGDERTRLPSFPDFDIRMDFTDKVLDEDCEIFFDLFNIDGIIGDTFLVNGKVQPFLNVKPRRYRFRWLDAGPSRFYEMFFTNLNNLNQQIPFWHIANDGNLLPRPVEVTSVRIGVAERHDVIMDFRPFRGQTIYLENRLRQLDGRGPVPPPNDIHPAGQGNLLMQIRVDNSFGPPDRSGNPAQQTFYNLPDRTETPRIQRTFKFDRLNGQWSINGRFMTCDEIRFRIKKNSVDPVSAKARYGNKRDKSDMVTAKLAALQFYQLAIPAPTPPDGSFNKDAAARGESIFTGKAKCSTCHVPPLFTEPGHNAHKAADIGIDDFQANRSPDKTYRTSPLRGLWAHQKGGFYHDGRFAALNDVVEHYNSFFKLRLTQHDKSDLVEYLKSL